MGLIHRMASLAFVALAASSSSGCHKATFIDPNAARGEEHEQWTDFFIFGLVGTEEQDVRRYCRGPVALVRTGGNVGTGIVTILTLGIYAPRKVYVTCAAGPAAPPPAALRIEERSGVPARVSVGESSGATEQVADGVWRVRVKREGRL